MPVLRGRIGRETDRLEAFTDGVIAIAITLLTLDISVPARTDLHGNSLPHALGQLWPNYLAFLTTFAVIGIIWMNHHTVFEHIARTDDYLALINTLFLMTVAVLPFTTALVSEYLGHNGARTAVLVYTGWFVLVAVTFNGLWRWARHADLLKPDADPVAVARITRLFNLGPPSYFVLFLVALISPIAALVGMGLLAMLYVLPNQA